MSDHGRGGYIFVYTRIQKFIWMCMLVPGVAGYSEERERGNVGNRKGCVCMCIHTYANIHVDVYIRTWCDGRFRGKGTLENGSGVHHTFDVLHCFHRLVKRF